MTDQTNRSIRWAIVGATLLGGMILARPHADAAPPTPPPAARCDSDYDCAEMIIDALEGCAEDTPCWACPDQPHFLCIDRSLADAN